jgi:hypothetical protein
MRIACDIILWWVMVEWLRCGVYIYRKSRKQRMKERLVYSSTSPSENRDVFESRRGT